MQGVMLHPQCSRSWPSQGLSSRLPQVVSWEWEVGRHLFCPLQVSLSRIIFIMSLN